MSTELPKGLYPKLLYIQKRIVGLGKDKKGSNYEYVTGNKVLGEIKPLMNELGLLLKQEVTSIENVRQDYKTGIGTQYEKPKAEILSKVMMKFTWIDTDTGEKDENFFGANGQNDWEKGLGSALTYAERYFLLKYFHIATDEDDIDNPERKPVSQEKAVETIKSNVPELDLAIEEMNNVANIEDLKKLWSKYVAIQKDAKFTAAKDKRKKELTPNQK